MDEELQRLPTPAWPIGSFIAHFRNVATREEKLPRNSRPIVLIDRPSRRCAAYRRRRSRSR